MGNQCCAQPGAIQASELVPAEPGTIHVSVEVLTGDHDHEVAVDHFELSGIILHDEESVTQSGTPSHVKEKFMQKVASNKSRTRTLSNLGDVGSSDRLTRVNSRASSSLGVQQSALPEVVRPNFQGSWTCIDTWGMDEFLKAMGIGYVQRMAASRAPWPTWEFESLGQDIILFVNHGPLGDIEEEIEIGGAGYSSIDGRRQTISNKAYWKGDGEISKLIIERSGPQGEFIEERSLDGSKNLVFVLKAKLKSKEVEWGRTFKLKLSD